VFAIAFLLMLSFSSINGGNVHPIYVNNGIILYVGGTDGDTVFVYDDSSPYFEHGIVINTSITLKGEDKNTTVIDGKGTFDRSIWIKADNVSISGFTITNGSYVGVFMMGQHVVIADNVLTGNQKGVDYMYAHHSIISSNLIYANRQYGITRSESFHVAITNNTIHSHNYGAIALSSCKNCTIAGNELYHNSWGISLHSGWAISREQNNVVKRNIIYSNHDGIFIEKSINNVVTENNIIGNYNNAGFIGGIELANNPYNPTRPCYNQWKNNYWSDWNLTLPKPIFGKLDVLIPLFPGRMFLFSWLNFDWSPATEPYEW